MADFDLSGLLGLDPSEFVSGADEAADAMEDVSAEAEATSDSLADIDASGVAAGGAVAGVGTAAQGALDDTQAMRETLGRTAVSTEMTREETMKMAQEISNATYPIEDATATMDALAQQGVTSEERLAELSTASDNLADATGHSAEEIASNLGPAVKGLDGDLGALEEDADTFTTVLRNTTLDAQDLGKVLERSGDDLREMGLSADDASQMVAAYADETGKSGRQAARDFSTAVSDAEGDTEQLKDELGLTEEQIKQFSGEMEENQGATEEFGGAANESTTTMDALGDKFDDVKLSAAETIGPIDAIAPAMQTAGIAAMTLSTINFSAVIPSLVGVATAAAPVVVPILAIAAAVGGLYYAWENNLFGIRDIADDVFGTLTGWADDFKDAFPNSFGEAVGGVMSIFEGWDPRPPLRDAADDMWAALPSYDDFETLGGNLVTGLANGFYGAVGTVRDASGWLSDWVWSGVPSYSDFKTTGGNLVTGLVNGLYAKYSAIKSAADWLSDWVWSGVPDWQDFKTHGKNLVQGLVNGIYDKLPNLRDVLEYLASIVDAWTPDSDAEKGPLSNLTDWGRAVPETLAEGMNESRGAVAEAGRGMAAGAAPGGAGGMGVDVHVSREVDGPKAMQDLLDAIEPHVDTRIERKFKSQKHRSERLNRRNV